MAMTVAMTARTVIQGLLFILIARLLGAADYGAFSAVLALASAIGSLGGLGVNVLMVREVSRSEECFPSAWGSALMAITISGPPLLIAYLFLAWSIIPSSVEFLAIVFIGCSEILLTPLVVAAINAFQSHGFMGRASWVYLIPVLPRFAAALLLIWISILCPNEKQLSYWAILYFVATTVATIVCLALVNRSLARPIFPEFSTLRRQIREGFTFSVASATSRLYVDIDKTMLANLSTLAETGAYSAAHRIVDLATIPAQSLFITAARRFFQEGKNGLDSVLGFARTLLVVPLLGTLAASLTIFLLAGILPLILGSGFELAVSSLRWLAWLPCFSLLRLLLQSLLIGNDRHQIVAVTLLSGAIINIMANLMLIPLFGWKGAVIAAYTGEIIMSAAMLAIIAKGVRSSRAN